VYDPPATQVVLTKLLKGENIWLHQKSLRRKSPVVTETPELWPGIDAHFRLIIVAAKRSKQLVRGATARIEQILCGVAIQVSPRRS